jgi:DUF4097 and DUF4098 domain-containing protein YvlB
VTITSGTGNISISASDSETTVLAEVSASGEEPIWTADLVGTELVIDDGCGDRTDCEVDLTISVAATADVTISSSDGGITIVNRNATVAITGAASNIVLNSITGPIDVDLTKGDLLGATLVSTVASFHTGDGSLDVTLTQAFTSLTVTSGSGDITAQVPDGGYDIDAVSDDGSVDIKVDDVAGAAASIVMRTGSGDVTIYKR